MSDYYALLIGVGCVGFILGYVAGYESGRVK